MKPKRFAKLTALLLAAMFVLTSLATPVSAYDLKRYENLENIYSYANLTEESAREVGKMPVEIENFLKLYLMYSYYELNREQAINTMLRNLVKQYPDAVQLLADSLLTAFDPFGGYFTDSSTDEIMQNNQYTGFGIILKGVKNEGAYSTGVLIDEVLNDSPAKKAGVKAGDIIYSINGRVVENIGTIAISDYLSTQKSIELIVKREDSKITLKLNRGAVKTKTVTYKIIDEPSKTALVSITNFTDNAILDEYEEALSFLSINGYKNIIFDLRDNLGGSVLYMTAMVDMLIPEKEKLMFSLLMKGNEKEDFYSSGIGYKFDSFSIITNEYTASAAEMFAIALSETKNAKRIGTKTYGKGIGQSYLIVNETDIAAITSIECVSPSGVKYNKKGLTPDYAIGMTIKDVSKTAFEQLNFVSCRTIKADAKNKAVLALNQRLCRIGYLSASDVNDMVSDNTVNAVEILQELYSLPVGIDKIDYRLTDTLAMIISFYAPTKYFDGDPQLEAALKLMTTGDTAVRQYMEELANAKK